MSSPKRRKYEMPKKWDFIRLASWTPEDLRKLKAALESKLSDVSDLVEPREKEKSSKNEMPSSSTSNFVNTISSGDNFSTIIQPENKDDDPAYSSESAESASSLLLAVDDLVEKKFKKE